MSLGKEMKDAGRNLGEELAARRTEINIYQLPETPGVPEGAQMVEDFKVAFHQLYEAAYIRRIAEGDRTLKKDTKISSSTFAKRATNEMVTVLSSMLKKLQQRNPSVVYMAKSQGVDSQAGKYFTRKAIEVLLSLSIEQIKALTAYSKHKYRGGDNFQMMKAALQQGVE